MKLVLVRHGRTQCAEENRLACWYDTPLSQRGIEELKSKREKYDYPKTDYYYVTTLKRTVQTFEILYPGITYNGALPQFKEHYMGSLEGVEMNAEIGYRKWRFDECHYGEEGMTEFSGRILNALKQLYREHKDDTVTLVAHAGVVRVLYMYMKGINFTNYDQLAPINGEAYFFDVCEENDNLVLSHYSTLSGSEIEK